ncbi:hypothetical protein AB4571_01800 [Vibrio breoganii]
MSDLLESVDQVYVSDAYNSLSIEGYAVTEELISRVVIAGLWYQWQGGIDILIR